MVRKTTNPRSTNDAFLVAMKSLQRSAQTERGLRDKLSTRQYNHDVVEATISKLKETRLIDDLKYAENFVSYQNRISPRGARYLKLRLIQKGVDAEIAEQVTLGITSDHEFELASQVSAKRLPQLDRFEPQQRKLKLARYLAARGFAGEIIYKVIGSISKDNDDEIAD